MNELDGCAYTLVPGLGLVLGARPLPVSGLRFAPRHPASSTRALAAPVEPPKPAAPRQPRPSPRRNNAFAVEPVARWAAGEALLVPGSPR